MSYQLLIWNSTLIRFVVDAQFANYQAEGVPDPHLPLAWPLLPVNGERRLQMSVFSLVVLSRDMEISMGAFASNLCECNCRI